MRGPRIRLSETEPIAPQEAKEINLKHLPEPHSSLRPQSDKWHNKQESQIMTQTKAPLGQFPYNNT